MNDAFSDRSSSQELEDDQTMETLLRQHNSEYTCHPDAVNAWQSNEAFDGGLEHDHDDTFLFPSMFQAPYPIHEGSYSTSSVASSSSVYESQTPRPAHQEVQSYPPAVFQSEPASPASHKQHEHHRSANGKKDRRPRCYDHGCNGRIFSTQGNYKRHMMEKRKSKNTSCPVCHKVFTRKSNCDKHIFERRCSGVVNMRSYSFID